MALLAIAVIVFAVDNCWASLVFALAQLGVNAFLYYAALKRNVDFLLAYLGVQLALIVVVCLAAVGTIGSESNKKFEEVGAAIAAN